MTVAAEQPAATVTLIEAAFELGLPYQTAHNLVLTRVLDGARVGTRWVVTRASVERVRRERASATA